MLRSNVDTEVMIRIDRLIDNPRGTLGRWFFEAWRYRPDGSDDPGFELNQPRFRDARILIAGENFGCGSSREAAVWALADYGIQAVIAPTISDIFRANCFQNGILPIIMPKADVEALAFAVDARDGVDLTVDLERCEIGLAGAPPIRFSIEPERREALLAGLDEIGLTLKLDREIRAFQRQDAKLRPWIHHTRKAGLVRLLILAGDGVGSEVMAEVSRIVQWFIENRGLPVTVSEELFGMAAWNAHGNLMRDETWRAILDADAILFGATSFGSAEYAAVPAEHKQVDWLLRIRKELDLFNNIRPVKVLPGLAGNSTLRPEIIDSADLVIVRELAGGIYFGTPRGATMQPDGIAEAVNTLRYSEPEVRRIARAAFSLARQRRRAVCNVDKANVLEVFAFWRKIVEEVHRTEFPDVELRHMYVDNCAMQLVRNPKQFDVIVTENLFGDILSDCAAMISGSLGMLPSASLSDPDDRGRRHALYEPIHGSAPDIAGKGIVNPLGAVLSFALCLRYTMELPDEAALLERAVESAVARGVFTADIAPKGKFSVSTAEMGAAVLRELSALSGRSADRVRSSSMETTT
jgi:3-isopropylmalate dehydrogenase